MGFPALQQATLPLRQLGGHTFLNEGKQCRHHPHPLLNSPKTDLHTVGVAGGGLVFMLLPEEQQSTLTSKSSFEEVPNSLLLCFIQSKLQVKVQNWHLMIG